MKNFLSIAACICAAFILFSCAVLPTETSFSLPPETTVDMPPFERLVPPENIMGKGSVPAEKMAEFLLQSNMRANRDFVFTLSQLYVEEAAGEGVNHDIVFAQMCLETGFLQYGNLVTPDMNNFCGLGAIGPGQPGLSFPNPRTGVRAHIQHIKAYATDRPLNNELVDPRYRYVKLGSSPAIYGLSGTWAADMGYGVKIKNILQRLYEFSFDNN